MPESHCAFTDIITFRGCYFLGFMEGPKHMVDDKNHSLILVSQDGENWEKVCRIYCGKDTREPKFMELNGKLLCFFFTIEPSADGTHMLTDSWYIESIDGRIWSEPVCFAYKEKYWRPVNYKGTAYCVTHPKDPAPEQPCRLMRSQNGKNWEHLADIPIEDSQKPNEAALAFDEEGILYIFIRTDRDQCEAYLLRSKEPYTVFEKKSLGMRLGGPLLWFDRRNIFLGARFYLESGYPHTGIFQLDEEIRPHLLVVLPSMGDSSYMGITRKTDDSGYLISYYSSHESLGGDLFSKNHGSIYVVETCDTEHSGL